MGAACCTTRDRECEPVPVSARSLLSAATPRPTPTPRSIATPRPTPRSLPKVKSSLAATPVPVTTPAPVSAATPKPSRLISASPNMTSHPDLENVNPQHIEFTPGGNWQWSAESWVGWAAPNDGLFDFDDMDDDALADEDLDKMAQDAAAIGESQEKKEMVLSRSEGLILTCTQLRVMVEMCSKDDHKKDIINERYAQLHDQENFVDEILDRLALTDKSGSPWTPKLMQNAAIERKAVFGGA